MPVLLFLLLAAMATASDYAGAGACRACHPAQFKAQSDSGHARGLARAADHPLAQKFPWQGTHRRGPFTLRLEDGMKARVEGTVEVSAEWAFGAGDQAVTFVGQIDEDRYLEHHLTYYAKPAALAPTPGHGSLTPGSALEAAGVVYPTFDPRSAILRCFQCHSTGPLRLGERYSIVPHELGVRCESCHGPAAAHAREPKRANVRNPGRLNAPALNELCGGCHRPPASDDGAINFRDPWNTRHQPPYLARSRCFTESEGRLSCLTCHDPHEALRRNDRAYYDARCLACHTESHPPAAVCRKTDAACHTCHMPAVKPNPALAFHNHWIGVFTGGSALQPR